MARRWLICGALALVACSPTPAAPDDAATASDSSARDSAMPDAAMPDAFTLDAAHPTDGGPRCASDHDCDDGHYCNGVETCMPDGAGGNAMGCVVGASPCMPSQQCDEAQQRCVTACAVMPDADHDGVAAIACGGTDCDDADAHRYPGNMEVCDAQSHDEDCNPSTFGVRDADGDLAIDAACCNIDPSGAHVCGTDCSDQRADVRPGLPEPCDGLDNDCDGTIDEGTSRLGAPDHDYDLHGDSSAMAVMGCPGDPGFSVTIDDCNDTNPSIFGAEAELCDGVDNNCNMQTDEVHGSVAWYPDADGDGFGDPDPARIQVSCTVVPGFTTRGGDCDDNDRDVNPAAHELCNGRDDDCNGRADYRIAAGDTEDDDGDGYADHTCGGNDCDDARGFVHPGAPEIADMIDDNCDGATDETTSTIAWYLDLDHDGYGDAMSAPMMSSSPIAMRVPRGGDCDDGDVFVHPGAIDRCDGHDDDCDGTIDEAAVTLAYYGDVDGDGWAGASGASVMLACAPPASASLTAGDCDDTRSTVHPGALETCDMLDDDCDGTIDENPTQIWYVDLDGDGHGTDPGTASCMPIAGRVTLGDDCDDTNALRYPGRAETCNGGDDDCDGMIDEGAASACGGAHTTGGACTSGACVLTCAPGFSDCDVDPSTGCETNTAHSPSSCGSCGNRCGPADTCGQIAPPGTCDRAPVVELSGGGYGMLARRSTGEVAAWGDDTNGAFADGGAGPVSPARAAGITHIAQMYTYQYGGCARTLAGSVVCWGTRTYAGNVSPSVVALPAPAISVCAGTYEGCAVLSDGRAYCWGDDSYGRLGDGAADGSVHAPSRMVDAAGPITDAVAITCSEYTTCVMRQRASGDRYVSCAGDGLYGGIGDGGVSTGSRYSTLIDVVGLPVDLVALNHGESYTDACVTDSNGRAYCWGYDNYAQIGVMGAVSQYSPVTPPGLDAGVVDIALSLYGGCAIRLGPAGARELLCWGADSGGGGMSAFLGGAHGATTFVSTPTLAIDASGAPIRDALAAARGYDFACVSRQSGGVWCAGGNDVWGQLGDAARSAGPATYTRVGGLD